jgi:hypothetical protein
VELFNRALDADEVMAIFLAGSAGKCECKPAPAYRNDIKWSQSPAEISAGYINGWDELSDYNNLPTPIVADDWLCRDNRPIKDIHWWGSFKGWSMCEPPPVVPSAFHIGIWTDVAKSHPDNPYGFSHPGEMIWENVCDCYVWSCAGYDVDPRVGSVALDPGFLYAYNAVVCNPPHAQTFRPIKSGRVTEIIHGLDQRGGLTEYDLYVFKIPANGTPPADYASSSDYLFKKTGLTTFSVGTPPVNGVVLTGSDAFEVTAGAQYALIIAPRGAGQMCWRGTSSGGAYTRGAGYLYVSGAWQPSPGAHGTGYDYSFQVRGRTERGDTCFQFDQLLSQDQWFHQDPNAYEVITTQLDPGLTRGSITVQGTNRVLAQTFRPAYSGYVTKIRHGLDERGGVSRFNLYLTLAEPDGSPPLTYATTYLFRALGLTEFSWGGVPVNGYVAAPECELYLSDATKYALILEKAANQPSWARMSWRGKGGTGAYPRGDAYEMVGSTWVKRTESPHDHTFQIIGSENCSNVYWLSIAAMYDGEVPEHPWGWKTRPHFANDDAVRITDLFDASWPPVIGSVWGGGEPIEHPADVSWDMAFTLTSNRKFSPLRWLWSSDQAQAADVDEDGIISFRDIAEVASYWLEVAN